MLLSLNQATLQIAKKKLPRQNLVRTDVKKMTEAKFETLVKEQAGKFLILIGHVEAGIEFVTKDFAGRAVFRIELGTIERLAIKHDVTVLALGCNIGNTPGLLTTGTMGVINTANAVQRVADTIHKSPTVLTFLGTLSAPEFQIVLREQLLTSGIVLRGSIARATPKTDASLWPSLSAFPNSPSLTEDGNVTFILPSRRWADGVDSQASLSGPGPNDDDVVEDMLPVSASPWVLYRDPSPSLPEYSGFSGEMSFATRRNTSSSCCSGNWKEDIIAYVFYSIIFGIGSFLKNALFPRRNSEDT